jgi:hypothetical protein
MHRFDCACIDVNAHAWCMFSASFTRQTRENLKQPTELKYSTREMPSNDTASVALRSRRFICKLSEVRKRLFSFLQPLLCLCVIASCKLDIKRTSVMSSWMSFFCSADNTAVPVTKTRYLHGTATSYIPVSTTAPVYTCSKKSSGVACTALCIAQWRNRAQQMLLPTQYLFDALNSNLL